MSPIRTRCELEDPLSAHAGEEFVPGSAAAEAAADALLMRAKACGLRVARCLREASAGSERRSALLARLACEVTDSCAYYTEAQLRRPARHNGRPVKTVALDSPGAEIGRSGCLSAQVAAGLPALAARLGLSKTEAAVWMACVRGHTVRWIAAQLGITTSQAYRRLKRAQRKADVSWLAAYRESVR